MTVYLLFRAFHTHPRFGVLLTGYAIGILFWFVSIVPQGIGLVEGMMALTYTSLGIPGEIGTIVSLSFRGLTFWIPLLIGFVLLQRLKTFSAGQRARADVWNVRVVAILTGLMGIINLLSGITPALAVRLRMVQEVNPVDINRGGHLTSVLAGFGLIVLAGGLWRRKRIAWWSALFVLAVSILSHLAKGSNFFGEAILGTVLLAWLVNLRPHFHARSDPPSLQHGLRVVALAFGFTLIYGTLGFYFLDVHFNQAFSLLDSLRETVILFTQFYNPGLIPAPLTGFARYFENSIYLVGIATIGYSLFVLARAMLFRGQVTPEERVLAGEIVQSHGRSSLARFTLFPDKTFFFSPGGTMFAYTVKREVALVLGDPIGPAEDFHPALNAFCAYCERSNWAPAFFQTLPDTVQGYQQAGFQTLSIGSEAIVDLSRFSLEDPGKKMLSDSFDRITQLGYSAQIFQPPLAGEIVAELRDISDEWLTQMNQSEKRFSLGWFFDDYVRTCPAILVCDDEGLPEAFANVLTEFNRNEVSIDMVRYRIKVDNGLLEYLLIALMEWAKAQGYTTFNLGLNTLPGVGEHNGDASTGKASAHLRKHINQLYSFKGLYNFKEKFDPSWSPRYLVYPDSASLSRVVQALVQADSGEALFTELQRRMKQGNKRQGNE